MVAFGVIGLFVGPATMAVLYLVWQELVADSPVELWSFPMQPAGYGASGALVRMGGVEPGGNSVVVTLFVLEFVLVQPPAPSARTR